MGSRLLQGLIAMPRTKLNVSFDIFIFDPDPDARALALERSSEVLQASGDANHDRVICIEQIRDCPSGLNLAILAATSRYRFENLRALFDASVPEALFLEKFLFDQETHYAEAQKLINARGIPAWVHCPRPSWPAYRDIDELDLGTPLRVEVSGQSYGLASNSVHFLDLARYIFGQPIETVVTDGTLSVAAAKRSGFREIFGSLHGLTADGRAIIISCGTASPPTVKVRVEFASASLEFDEAAGQRAIIRSDGTIADTQQMTPVPASLNTVLFEAILSGAPVPLPNYEQATTAHLALLQCLMPVIGEHGRLPVT